jgi:serine/threonine protein kinase
MHNFNNSAYDGTAVDVWSCGIILFIMVYGRHPYLRREDTQLGPQQQVRAGAFSGSRRAPPAGRAALAQRAEGLP